VGRRHLTSYGGLELLRPYVRRLGLNGKLRTACATMGGDYGAARLALLIMSLFYVGARRLEQLHYLAGDPLITRFCGLARVPSSRTVVNWLKQFTQSSLAPLVQLNHELVADVITPSSSRDSRSISMAPSCARAPPSRGRFVVSIRIIGSISATTPCWL
jgi:hypothetical protein